MAKFDKTEIVRGLNLLFEEGQIVELRVPKTSVGTIAGFYNEPRALIRDIMELSGEAPGIYYTLNPINPEAAPVKNLSFNELHYGVDNGDTTANEHILARKWFYVDVDVPSELKGKNSATDAEKEAVANVAESLRADLMEQGWPEPAVCDSGNGRALYWRINEPNDEATLLVIKRCLTALNKEYSQPGVAEIDTKVCNASRITKVYGSLSAKGENTKERPHRIARVLTAPEQMGVVTREQLEALAATAPQLSARPTDGSVDEAMMEDCLDAFGVDYEKRDEGVWTLRECPWAAEHTSSRKNYRDVEVVLKGGIPGFNCLHAACQEFADPETGETRKRTWRDFRNHFDHDHSLYQFPVEFEEREGFDVEELEVKPPLPQRQLELNDDTTPEPNNDGEPVADKAPEGVASAASKALKYPELRFPYEALPEGQFKSWIDKACEGGLSAGLVVPALLTLASAIPAHDVMEGARINLYCCLLSLVGAGKDTSIDRAIDTLGLRSHTNLWTPYTPNGERSVSNLLGDKNPPKGQKERIPGFKRHCIVSYELEETMKKAKGESSSVLEMMQHLYDHNVKVFSENKSGTTPRTDCRTSWLTALPVGDGEIDEDTFRRVFGESSTHGTTSRMLFGFSEERFDRRRSRNWSPGQTEWAETKMLGAEVGADIDFPVPSTTWHSRVEQLSRAKVEGFAPGVEDLYLSWKPIYGGVERDMSGRDTYHILKLSILTALLNGHKRVEKPDWEFAAAFMQWQANIRRVFTPGRTKENTPTARLIEKIMAGVERATEKAVAEGTPLDECYFRWRGLSHDGKWWKLGPDVARTIDQLVQGGALFYKKELETSPDGKDKVVTDKKYIRLARRKGEE